MSETVRLTMPPLGGPGDEEVLAAQAVLLARSEALDERARRSTVACTSQVATGRGCGGEHEIGSLVYIQTHHYVSPHGCTGGDYWLQDEGQWRCPSCGHLNRLYDSPDVQELKSHFKSVENRHDR